MVKRKVGERARILFDDIDLKILKLLDKSQGNNIYYSIEDLADKLSLKHKNLKPHVDKLLMLKLIYIFKDLDGKNNIFSEIDNRHKPNERKFKTREDYINALIEVEKKRALFNYLEQSNSFSLSGVIKNKEFDIRKMKRGTSIGSKIITTKQAKKIINNAFS